MAKYEELTSYIYKLVPITEETVLGFCDAVYSFEKQHPEYALADYLDTMLLYAEPDAPERDVDGMDARAVLAELMCIVRGNIFIDDLIAYNIESGYIQKLLTRLAQLDY